MNSRTPLRSISAVISSTTPSRNPNFRKRKVAEGDRYVALRSDDQIQLASHLMSQREESQDEPACKLSPASKLEQQTKLNLMRVKSENGDDGDRVCAFRKGLAPLAQAGHRQQINVLYSCMNPSSSCIKRSRRYIIKDPERMLDAPTLRNDYYTNLLDWSGNNVVAVALGQKVYVWCASTGEVNEMADFTTQQPEYPTMVKWSHEGCYLAIGFSDGRVMLYNATSQQHLRTLKVVPVSSRVACASWTKKGHLCYGSRVGRIYNHDVTAKTSLISEFDSHTSEVCGLKWSPDQQYLTSGGGDRLVNVWEFRQISTNHDKPLYTFDDHVASVKAIEYGLKTNVVATGGGTNDHTVKFWNLYDGSCQYTVDTQSQVTGILFNKIHNEMITSHGLSRGGIRVWSYDPNRIKKYEPNADLNLGQTNRVIAISQSPCGEYIMAASEDEVLRLWHVWKVDASMKLHNKGSVTANAHHKKQLLFPNSSGNNIR